MSQGKGTDNQEAYRGALWCSRGTKCIIMFLITRTSVSVDIPRAISVGACKRHQSLDWQSGCHCPNRQKSVERKALLEMAGI
nr:hypothetical protein CFP56_24006 [Quercus suber]